MIRRILLALVVSIVSFACAAATSNRVDAAAYQAQMLNCIDLATTLAQSQQCRCQVARHYGREGHLDFCHQDAGTDAKVYPLGPMVLTPPQNALLDSGSDAKAWPLQPMRTSLADAGAEQ